MLNQEKAESGALQGVTVLDLTRLLPGAFCTQMLADFGAAVIKIEQPGVGDYNRSFPPIANEESGSFLMLNRNKKSVTLDLKNQEGKAVLMEMVKTADILVEGFRPGVMERLSLSYETLSEINPRLIYCAITGYGQTGPARLKPGHDLNYMAEAGALQLFGRAGEGPIVPGLSIADVGGGSLMASTGILAALHARSRTGRGQFVDISMHDGVMSWLAFHGPDTFFAGVEPKGGERPFIGQAPCYNIYVCGDGNHVALGIIEEHFWARFCDAVNKPELKQEQWPVGEAAERQKAELAELFATRTRDEWVNLLEPVDIPFGPVFGIAEAFADSHAQHREMLQFMDHPVEGRIPQIGFPVKLSDTPCSMRTPPPLLGEHNREMLRTLGYPEAKIRAMEDAGII